MLGVAWNSAPGLLLLGMEAPQPLTVNSHCLHLLGVDSAGDTVEIKSWYKCEEYLASAVCSAVG